MKISHFTKSSQQTVTNFWTEIFEEMGWKVSTIDGFDDISTFFHLPEGFFLIVEDDEGKIVGCGGVKPLVDSVGIIKRFYITSPLRGKELAKDLLEKIIEESKKEGYSLLVLDVYYTNTRAMKFYEKNGFKLYKQTPDPQWSESQAPDKFFYYQLPIIRSI